MNILYIGGYRDGIGYGHAARENIIALNKVGLNVACRPLTFTNRKSPICDIVQSSENKSFSKYDVIIQHSLPDFFYYSGQCGINVGITYMETSPAPYRWTKQCSTMDVIWSSDEDMSKDLTEAGINNEIMYIPTDVKKYEKEIKPLESIKRIKDSGYFVFYTVGEMVRRKNLYGLMQAFFSEFRDDEPVKLVIKTSLGTLDKQSIQKVLSKNVEDIRTGMLLYPKTDKIEFIGSWLSDEQILQFHKSCDCFVQVSHGEGFSLPAFDAMAMGKTPIVSNQGGYKNYIDNSNGWLVDCKEEICFGETPHYPDLFNGVSQKWDVPSVLHLRKCMREAYSNSLLRAKKASLGLERAKKFSYELIGTQMAEALEKYVKKRTLARPT